MSGPKPYPAGFLRDVIDIAGGCCELCGGNRGLSTHHIFPRSIGRTIHKFWNCIYLCDDCHTPQNFEGKVEMFGRHLVNIWKHCLKWGKAPAQGWAKLIPNNGRPDPWPARLEEMRIEVRGLGWTEIPNLPDGKPGLDK